MSWNLDIVITNLGNGLSPIQDWWAITRSNDILFSIISCKKHVEQLELNCKYFQSGLSA